MWRSSPCPRAVVWGQETCSSCCIDHSPVAVRTPVPPCGLFETLLDVTAGGLWQGTQAWGCGREGPALPGSSEVAGGAPGPPRTCSKRQPSDMVDTICVSSSSWHCSTRYTCLGGTCRQRGDVEDTRGSGRRTCQPPSSFSPHPHHIPREGEEAAAMF